MMLTAEWILRTSRADQQPPTFIFFLRNFELTCTKHEWNLHCSAPTLSHVREERGGVGTL